MCWPLRHQTKTCFGAFLGHHAQSVNETLNSNLNVYPKAQWLDRLVSCLTWIKKQLGSVAVERLYLTRIYILLSRKPFSKQHSRCQLNKNSVAQQWTDRDAVGNHLCRFIRCSRMGDLLVHFDPHTCQLSARFVLLVGWRRADVYYLHFIRIDVSLFFLND